MISLLDDVVINKIAAGEVIERPVNIVKELVENALDAGAQTVLVEVDDELIRVTDDGIGMSKEDLEKCILRHATSKIKRLEDLEDISTLGFRGEALASIASVSSFRLCSRQKGVVEGYELSVEGGNMLGLKLKGCPEGTAVEVKDLFFNTPVRRKFLDEKEEDRIISFLQKFVLSSSVKFRLILHGKIVIDVSAPDIQSRLVQLHGLDIVKELLPVHAVENDIEVDGYVSKPSLVRKDKSLQAVFVNHRLVESEEVSRGLYEAYKSLLFVHKHPLVVLNIMARWVDVNVHPTKSVVRFASPEKVYSLTFRAVRTAFQEASLVFPTPESLSSEEILSKDRAIIPLQLERAYKRFSEGTQQGLVHQVSLGPFQRLPELRLLGNIAKTFFLAETVGGLMIIDQHIVEERINYEKFIQQYAKQEVQVQELLMPQVVEFNPGEAIQVQKHIKTLQRSGFFLEDFGENSFRITKVPVFFLEVQGVSVLRDLLVDFKEDYKENILTMMACRKSIKAGDIVSVEQMYSLLKKLDVCELPFTCPHGRPIMVNVSLEDLEKMFRRRGF